MAKIKSRDIPQADVLNDVIKTVVAISQGAKTYQDIASALEKVERQGRYYRRAAEILGFIANVHNTSVLTVKGKEFAKANPSVQKKIVFQSVVETRIFQRLIAYFEAHKKGVSRNQMASYISEVTATVEGSTLSRRVLTVASWLQELEIIEKRGNKFFLKKSVLENIPILNFTSTDEPILPRSGSLSEYQRVELREASAKKEIEILKDQAKLERANNKHKELVNLVASKIRNSGALPRSNRLIDLATKIDNVDYIFEMKSFTQTNVKDQIRKGMSQLYEYRYLQNLPKAKLVLVGGNKLEEKNSWFLNYLENDRDIMFLWEGSKRLCSSEKTKKELSFLW